MIITDHDGTLLRTDKAVSEYTKGVLRQCRKTGIKAACSEGSGGSAEKAAQSELFDGRISPLVLQEAEDGYTCA